MNWRTANLDPHFHQKFTLSERALMDSMVKMDPIYYKRPTKDKVVSRSGQVMSGALCTSSWSEPSICDLWPSRHKQPCWRRSNPWTRKVKSLPNCGAISKLVRLLHNMQVVNNRWAALKHALPPEDDGADDHFFNDAQHDTLPVQVDDLAQPSSSAVRPAVTSNDSQLLGAQLDLVTYTPTSHMISRCRREVSFYQWSHPAQLEVWNLACNAQSRAEARYSWHLSQEALACLWGYFHGLQWSRQGKISLFELFCDLYASTGVDLMNKKNRRGNGPLRTCADFTSSLASALRLPSRQVTPSVAPHPATHVRVSHLTQAGSWAKLSPEAT